MIDLAFTPHRRPRRRSRYRLDPDFAAPVNCQYWLAQQANDRKRVREFLRLNIFVEVATPKEFRRAQRLAALINFERPFVVEEGVE